MKGLYCLTLFIIGAIFYIPVVFVIWLVHHLSKFNTRFELIEYFVFPFAYVGGWFIRCAYNVKDE